MSHHNGTGVSRQPIPVVDWEATDEQWVLTRRVGCGGSNVASVLELSHYRSAWNVWAEKVGHPGYRPVPVTPAIVLGNLLEPWLLDQSGETFGRPATVPDARTYAFGEPHLWRMCSPDGIAEDGWIVECKTSGLASKAPRRRCIHGDEEWVHCVPLEYELQARWNTHVMNADGCHVVALVGGLGLLHFEIERDHGYEEDLISAVGSWWNRYIDGTDEPDVSGLDNEALTKLYPTAKTTTVDLDLRAELDAESYVRAHRAEVEAGKRKADAAARLKRRMGDAGVAVVGTRRIATWKTTKSGNRQFRIPTEFVNSLTESETS